MAQPTAEAVFRNEPGLTVRSAGTSEGARIKITAQMAAWADIIFVMEKRHRQLLQQRYSIPMHIVVLNIPDEYRYMDPELVVMLQDMVTPYLR